MGVNEDKLAGLIGAEDLKKYIDKTKALFLAFEDREKDMLDNRAVLMSINEGDGLRTWLFYIRGMFRKMWDEEIEVKYYELKIPDLMDATNSKYTSKRDIVLGLLDEDDIVDLKYINGMGFRILCMDITKWIDNVESAEFRAVLSRLRATLGSQFVIFRIPAVDAVTLKRVKGAIEWFMNVDAIYCPPYSIEDYYSYGIKLMEERGIEADDRVREILRDLIERERRDRNFCGFVTVSSIVDRMTFAALSNKYGKKKHE